LTPIGDGQKAVIVNPAAHLFPVRLLVVDDSSQVRQMCCETAEGLGFVVVETKDLTAAREILKQKDTDVLLLDLTWPENEAQLLITEMKSLCPEVIVIVMSASATIASAVETMRAGANDYLSKPFPLHVLTQTLERAVRRRCFDVERQQLLQSIHCGSEMGDVLGQSVEMEKLYRILSKVTDSTHPVMIVGETGTGKALVARSIHANGPDASKPFVAIDCKSMSLHSLESMLFGQSKSATGGVNMRSRGLLASLEGGTVFLDEIGDLALSLQGRLVRALKEKKVWPVNGTQAHSLSVRILVATSHDLTPMVRVGRFRMDLYRHLSLVNLKIPPLRGRPDDIAFLAERFLEKIRNRTGISRTLSSETLRMLETYDWPENTQELEVAITETLTLSSGPNLEINHLPERIVKFCRTREPESKRDFVPEKNSNDGSFRENIVPIATLEKLAILEALRQTNDDKREAAALLGIGKTTLYRKLKEYSLNIKTGSTGSSDSPQESTSTNTSDTPHELIYA